MKIFVSNHDTSNEIFNSNYIFAYFVFLSFCFRNEKPKTNVYYLPSHLDVLLSISVNCFSSCMSITLSYAETEWFLEQNMHEILQNKKANILSLVLASCIENHSLHIMALLVVFLSCSLLGMF